MIPLGVDRTSRNTPWVTISIVVTNILVFLVLSLGIHNGQEWANQITDAGVFYPHWSYVIFEPSRIITHAFLHAPDGLGHVGFNMLFLWVFGRAVEGRLGSVWFAAFYLSGAAVAAIGEWTLTDGGGMIGASGAVAAVTGAFAALCPRARVRVLLIFSVIEVPGLLLVTLFVAIDLIGQFTNTLSDGYRIAYWAHLAGYAWGASVMIALLGFGILPRNEFDLFFLLKQWRRRRVMRAAFSGDSSPWQRDALRNAPTKTPARAATANRLQRPHDDSEVRRELAQASANWTRENYPQAAAQWERFAARYPSHPDSDGALLLAAMAFARKLDSPAKALDLATRLSQRVPAPQPEILAQANALIAETKAQGSKASSQ